MNIHTRAILFMYKLQIHQLVSPLFCLNVQKSLSHRCPIAALQPGKTRRHRSKMQIKEKYEKIRHKSSFHSHLKKKEKQKHITMGKGEWLLHRAGKKERKKERKKEKKQETKRDRIKTCYCPMSQTQRSSLHFIIITK